MLGRDLLVAPIVEPGAKGRAVWLRQAHGAISSLAKPFRAAGNATPNARWSAFLYTKG